MRQPHLILITGLPGTGKSTLARALARHFRAPLICKDTIKEPLLDLLGAPDRAASRRLSDTSFAVMFSLARDCLRAGTDVILEGNFRPGEHEAPLYASIGDAAAAPRHATTTAADDVRITQILCRAPEPVRIARLKARATDSSRHAGHRDAELAANSTADHAVNRAANPTANHAANLAVNATFGPTVAFESTPATNSSPSASDYLALPGERLVFDSDGDSTQLQALLDSLEPRHRDSPHV